MKIAKFVLPLMVIILLSFSVSAEEAIEYKTIEGEVSRVGTDPFGYTRSFGSYLQVGRNSFIMPVVITEEGKQYTVTGDRAGILLTLNEAQVRITGRLESAAYPRADKNIVLKEYTVLEVGPTDANWAIGEVKYSEEGYVLVGKDQVIYYITGFEEDLIEEKLENTKAVISGNIKFKDDFEAVIDAFSYRVLLEEEVDIN